MIQKRKYSSRSNPRLGLCVIGLLRSSLIINVLFQVIGSVWNDKWGMQCKKKKKIMVRALLYLCFWMPVLLRTDRVPVRTVKVHLAKLFLQSHFGKFCHVPDQSRWSQTTVHSHFTGTVELFPTVFPFPWGVFPFSSLPTFRNPYARLKSNSGAARRLKRVASPFDAWLHVKNRRESLFDVIGVPFQRR